MGTVAQGTVLRRVTALIRASHPEPTAVVTVVSGALAAATGRHPAGVLAVGAAVLAGQLSIGWCNDYVDRERDRTAGRRDKPVVAGAVPPRVVGVAAAVALVACVPLSLLSGLPAAVVHLAGVLAAWAYNLRLKATALSVLPYVVGFGALPAFVVLGLPGHPAPPGWMVAAGSLLGCGAHFANVLPDIEDDLRAGVRGLPHRLGPVRSRLAAGVLLLAAAVLLTLGPPGPPGVLGLIGLLAAAGGIGGGLALAARLGSRAAFRAVLLVALLDIGLLLLRGRTLR